jgi:hypothetical protein
LKSKRLYRGTYHLQLQFKKFKPNKNLAKNESKQSLAGGLFHVGQGFRLDSNLTFLLLHASLFLGLFFKPEDG